MSTDETAAPTNNPFLRIRFVVEEIGEGGVPTERHISFGDEVPHHQARDFFERCGLTVDQLFCRTIGGLRAIVLDGVPQNKIQCIKVVRELTGVGLKEAKDLVESTVAGVPRGHIMACKHPMDVVTVTKRFNDQGISVRAVPIHSVCVGLPTANVI